MNNEISTDLECSVTHHTHAVYKTKSKTMEQKQNGELFFVFALYKLIQSINTNLHSLCGLVEHWGYQ